MSNEASATTDNRSIEDNRYGISLHDANENHVLTEKFLSYDDAMQHLKEDVIEEESLIDINKIIVWECRDDHLVKHRTIHVTTNKDTIDTGENTVYGVCIINSDIGTSSIKPFISYTDAEEYMKKIISGEINFSGTNNRLTMAKENVGEAIRLFTVDIYVRKNGIVDKSNQNEDIKYAVILNHANGMFKLNDHFSTFDDAKKYAQDLIYGRRESAFSNIDKVTIIQEDQVVYTTNNENVEYTLEMCATNGRCASSPERFSSYKEAENYAKKMLDNKQRQDGLIMYKANIYVEYQDRTPPVAIGTYEIYTNNY